MSIWNKILVGLIFVASVAFFYMAARTLKTHEYWKSVAQGYEFLIDVQNEFAENCENGGRLALLRQDATEEHSDTTELRQIASSGKFDRAAMESRIEEIEKETAGIRRLKFELSCLTQERGRAWYGCSPQPQGEQKGTVRVNVSETDAHGIPKNSEMFVFEKWPLKRGEDGNPQGGRYLGEFVVTAVDPDQVWIDLKRVIKPTDEEQKLSDGGGGGTVAWINAAGNGTRTLYVRMPFGGRKILAEMSDEEFAIRMPPATLAEYIHDGNEATKADLVQWQVDGKIEDDKYVRLLRNYRARFKYYHQQRPILIDRMETAIRDAALAVAAQAAAEKELNFRRQGVIMFKERLAKYERQRDAAKAHLDMLEVADGKIQKSIDQISAANQASSAKIARAQKALAEQVEDRTRRMALGAGGN